MILLHVETVRELPLIRLRRSMSLLLLLPRLLRMLLRHESGAACECVQGHGSCAACVNVVLLLNTNTGMWNRARAAHKSPRHSPRSFPTADRRRRWAPSIDQSIGLMSRARAGAYVVPA